jgi:hypothetical protein
MLATYIHFKRTSKHYAWLKQDLENVNHEVTQLMASWQSPCTIVTLAIIKNPSVWDNKWKTLYKCGVDLAFNGHVSYLEIVRLNKR